jgi:hypothetical protein
MTPSELLHIDASTYANNRIQKYKEALSIKKLEPLTQQMSGELWVAYYEGYVAGYEAKLREKNSD